MEKLDFAEFQLSELSTSEASNIDGGLILWGSLLLDSMVEFGSGFADGFRRGAQSWDTFH